MPALDCKVVGHSYVYQHVPTSQLKRSTQFTSDNLDTLIGGKENFLTESVPYLIETTDWEFYPDQVASYKRLLGRGPAEEKKPTELLPGELPGLAPMEDCMDYYPCLLVDIGSTVRLIKV